MISLRKVEISLFFLRIGCNCDLVVPSVMGTLSVEGSVATDQARVAIYHTIGPEHVEF